MSIPIALQKCKSYEKKLSDIRASILTQQRRSLALGGLERHLESGNRQLKEENQAMRMDIVSITKENRSLKQQRKTLVRKNELLGKQVLSLSLVNKDLQDVSEEFRRSNTDLQKKKSNDDCVHLDKNPNGLCELLNVDSLSRNINLLLEKLSKFEGSKSWQGNLSPSDDVELQNDFIIEELNKEKDFADEELRDAGMKIAELEKEIAYYKERVFLLFLLVYLCMYVFIDNCHIITANVLTTVSIIFMN